MNSIQQHHRARLRNLEDQFEKLREEAVFDGEMATIAGASSAAAGFQQLAGGERVARRLPNRGFASLRDFVIAVQHSEAGNRWALDPRLGAYAAATTFANEATAGEGAWAVPEAFSPGITEAIQGPGSLLGALRLTPASSNIIRVAVDQTTPGSASGIAAAKTGEGAATTATVPALEGRNVVLYKAAGLVHVTEELADDAPEATEAIGRIVSREVRAQAERWLLRGSGVGEPLGILNSPATIAVAGTGAGTLTTTHLADACARFTAGAGSFIAASPSATGALRRIQLDGGQLPYPIVTSLELPALGTRGDAILVDPAGFLAFTRGVTSQATIFFRFSEGLTSLRAFIRIGMAPLLSSPIVPALDTTTTISHSVTVATRT